MNDLVRTFRKRAPRNCQTRTYTRDRCSIRMAGMPRDHVTIDMDCPDLPLSSNSKRCDFLFVGKNDSDAWVAPIELKSGGFRTMSVAAQLQVGADLADCWLPAKANFRFVPVVAHGQGIHREQSRALRRAYVNLRGQRRRPSLVHCGSALRQALCSVAP